MAFFQVFADYSLITIVSLALVAFAAGFIDAVVGGGGLLQLPAILINFPNTALPTLFGTNKIAALSGTSIAAYQYSRKIRFDFNVLLPASLFSALASFSGAKVVSHINVSVLKPVILIILILIVIYTIIKKDLGSVQTRSLSYQKQAIYASLIGLVVGFYDGFFGPGTGSFLVLGFVVILGFEFVKASAYSKVINCITNISALVVFIRQGNFLLEIAILMGICNIIGSLLGTKLAIIKGNHFVRILFIIVVSLMIARYGYDVYEGFIKR
jgi:uncharacterized protein